MHSSSQAVEIWFLHALFYKLQPEYQFKDIETYSGTPVCQKWYVWFRHKLNILLTVENLKELKLKV